MDAPKQPRCPRVVPVPRPLCAPIDQLRLHLIRADAQSGELREMLITIAAGVGFAIGTAVLIFFCALVL